MTDAGFEVGADAPDTRGQELARREELLRQVVGKTCEGLFECYPVRAQRVYGADLPTCIEMEAPHFFALREEIEHVKVDEEQVRECLASLEQRPCHYLIDGNEYPLAQGCDFRGDKAVGEPCLHPWACETGLCSVRYYGVLAGVCDGFCQVRVEVGQPCDDEDIERVCADGSLCDRVANRCVYNLDVGDAIERNGLDRRACGTPLTAINGETCERRKPAGEACPLFNQCMYLENVSCENSTSGGPTEVCLTGEFVPLGGECKAGDFCEAGLRCSRFERCVVPAPEGESCERDACEWGLTCLDDVCRRPSVALCEEQAAKRAAGE